MITFKERDQQSYSIQDLMPQSATEAQAFLAFKQSQLQLAPDNEPEKENQMQDQGADQDGGKAEAIARRRSTIRKFRRENNLVKMKAINVHDAILQQ